MNKLTPALIVALAAGTFAGSSLALTGAEFSAARDRIKADYRAAKLQCDKLTGNAEDICEEEAKGKRDVARAELDQQREPSEKNARAVELAKAKAIYEVAEERCDDLQGEAEDRCEREARTAYDAALDRIRGK
ncbi:MAG: hypothetical protein Q4G70_13905 [Pseudomonadota bacterium]|nr:hypothetical protein [Pseudomonadota bacterium]